MFLLKLLTPIPHVNITLFCKLSIKNEHNKLMSDPVIHLDKLQLLIFPLHQVTIILPILHLVSIQFNQILDLPHGVPDVVRL